MTEEPQAEPEADTPWSTGDERVDEAVARLDDLDERDVDEHADVYDTIHGDLADVLDDAGPTGPEQHRRHDPSAAARRRARTPLAGPQP